MSRMRFLEELLRTHHRVISQEFRALLDDIAAHEQHSFELDPDDEDYQYYVANLSSHLYDLKVQVEGTLSVWDGSK